MDFIAEVGLPTFKRTCFFFVWIGEIDETRIIYNFEGRSLPSRTLLLIKLCRHSIERHHSLRESRNDGPAEEHECNPENRNGIEEGLYRHKRWKKAFYR